MKKIIHADVRPAAGPQRLPHPPRCFGTQVKYLVISIGCLVLSGCTPASIKPDAMAARAQVFAVEQAFARTMADRDLEKFTDYISEEAIFFTGPEPLRGKAVVVAWWARYFTGAEAPFSWEPEQVEVLASGTLALSSGPVRDPEGNTIALYNSIWRLETGGQWRIIFDKGSPVAASGN